MKIAGRLAGGKIGTGPVAVGRLAGPRREPGCSGALRSTWIDRRLSKNAGAHTVHRRFRSREGAPLRAVDEDLFHRGPALQGAVLRRLALVGMGRPATGFRRIRHGHRSGRPGAPGRLVRHPVQVLRARHADVEAASRFVHRGLRPRSLHGAHRRRYRRWMGAERRQDRCSAEASARCFASAISQVGPSTGPTWSGTNRRLWPSGASRSACGPIRKPRSTT